MKLFYLFFLFLLACAPLLFAGTVEWNGVKLEHEDKFSFQDMRGKDLTREIFKPGTTIYAAIFYSETPDTIIFPDTMKEVTFIECNTDNIFIPVGNIVKNVYREPPKRFKKQNDLRDWEINAQGIPTKVLDEQFWRDKGYSVDPIDIPPQPIDSIDKIPKPVIIPIPTKDPEIVP